MTVAYLSPVKFDGLTYTGALYGPTGLIDLDSLRDSRAAAYKPIDPVYLTSEQRNSALSVDQKLLFLGHSFSLYGHFLLESLPMLSNLIKGSLQKGIFLHWGKSDKILKDFLSILEIHENRVIVHRAPTILRGEIELCERPIAINGYVKSIEPYTLVINELKSRLSKRPTAIQGSELVYLDREPSRITEEFATAVKSYVTKEGFQAVRPENLSLAEQIELAANAKVMVGFTGSQMHNSLFCRVGTPVISLGDSRNRKSSLVNQVICEKISSCDGRFVPFQDKADLLVASLEAELATL